MTNAGGKRRVSPWRWALAPFAGIATWALLDVLTWNLLDLLGATAYYSLGSLIDFTIAIFVAGRLVGVRSFKGWLAVMLVAAVLAVIGFAVFLLGSY